MVGREGKTRPKMIRKMITIRLGENKEGLIFDTTPVIVHMVETTRSNKVVNPTKNNSTTDSICAEITRHTNTWENVSNCVICSALKNFDTENSYATNVPETVLGLYASSDRRSYLHNDGKWIDIVTTDGDNHALVVLTRLEYYDTNGHIYQRQIDVPRIKSAFENKTAI